MCFQSEFVKATEGTALGGLHSRLLATLWSCVPDASPWPQEGSLLPHPTFCPLGFHPPPHLHRSVL